MDVFGFVLKLLLFTPVFRPQKAGGHMRKKINKCINEMNFSEILNCNLLSNFKF